MLMQGGDGGGFRYSKPLRQDSSLGRMTNKGVQDDRKGKNDEYGCSGRHMACSG
jgi:hypothetical protein